MLTTEKIRLILLQEFATSQTRNPNYSMRAYAKKIGITQSAVSEILAGKRDITKKMATRILQGLDRDPSEITLLLNGEKANDTTFKPLDMDIFHAISDWYYYAILSLAETEDFQSSPAWIARRLGISHNVAEVAIERLLKLDLIKLDPATKKLKATGEQLAAVSDIARPALKKACRQNIELAQNALDETDFSERDFTAITLCFDPERMHEAKKMLKNFRRNFCRTMESGRKKEVYKLTLQLFPLTKKGIP